MCLPVAPAVAPTCPHDSRRSLRSGSAGFAGCLSLPRGPGAPFGPVAPVRPRGFVAPVELFGPDYSVNTVTVANRYVT